MTNWSGDVYGYNTISSGDKVVGNVVIKSGATFDLLPGRILYWDYVGAAGPTGYSITIEGGGRFKLYGTLMGNGGGGAVKDAGYGIILAHETTAQLDLWGILKNCEVAVYGCTKDNAIFVPSVGNSGIDICEIGIYCPTTSGGNAGVTGGRWWTGSVFRYFPITDTDSPVLMQETGRIIDLWIKESGTNARGIRVGTPGEALACTPLTESADPNWGMDLFRVKNVGDLAIWNTEKNVQLKSYWQTCGSLDQRSVYEGGWTDAMTVIRFDGAPGIVDSDQSTYQTYDVTPPNIANVIQRYNALKISGWTTDFPEITIRGKEDYASEHNFMAWGTCFEIDVVKKVLGVSVAGGFCKMDFHTLRRPDPLITVELKSHAMALVGYHGNTLIEHRLGSEDGYTFPNMRYGADALGDGWYYNLRNWIKIDPVADDAGDCMTDLIIANSRFNPVTDESDAVGILVHPSDYASLGDPTKGGVGITDVHLKNNSYHIQSATYIAYRWTDASTGGQSKYQTKMIDIALANEVLIGSIAKILTEGFQTFELREAMTSAHLDLIMAQITAWDGDPAKVTWNGTKRAEWISTGAAYQGAGIMFHKSSLQAIDWEFVGFNIQGIGFDQMRVNYGITNRFNALRRGVEYAASAYPFTSHSELLQCNTIIGCDVGIRNPSQLQWATLDHNNFDLSGTYAIQQVAGPFVLDAEDQYWGRGNGPSGAGPGTGDPVSTNVDFSPFQPFPCGATIFRIGSTDVYDYLKWPINHRYKPNAATRMDFKMDDPHAVLTMAQLEGQEIEAMIAGTWLLRGFADIVTRKVLDNHAIEWTVKGLDFLGRSRVLVVPSAASYDYSSTPKTIDAVFNDMISIIETQFSLGIFTTSATNPASAISFTIDVRRYNVVKVLQLLVKQAKSEKRGWWMGGTLACYFRAPVATAKKVDDTTGVDTGHRTRDIEDHFNRIIVQYSGGAEYIANDAASQALYGLREFTVTDNRITLAATAQDRAEAELEKRKVNEEVELTLPIDLFGYDLRDIIELTLSDLEISATDYNLEQIENEIRYFMAEGLTLGTIRGDTYLTFGKIPIELRQLLLENPEE